MTREYDVRRMARIILAIKKAANELKEASDGIQAVSRNVDRISAVVRILEINVNDVASIEE